MKVSGSIMSGNWIDKDKLTSGAAFWASQVCLQSKDTRNIRIQAYLQNLSYDFGVLEICMK